MKTFGQKIVAVNAVVLILIVHKVAGYSFNPFSWSNPGSGIEDPSFNPFLRAPYRSCSTGTNGIMRKVEVIPCNNLERCPLERGKNVTLDFEFIPNFPAKSIVGSLYGVMSTMLPQIKFGKPENLCFSNQVQCPVEAGKLYHYRTTVFVKTSYPRIKLDTKVLIQGDGVDIACALIPVEITNPST